VIRENGSLGICQMLGNPGLASEPGQRQNKRAIAIINSFHETFIISSDILFSKIRLQKLSFKGYRFYMQQFFTKFIYNQNVNSSQNICESITYRNLKR